MSNIPIPKRVGIRRIPHEILEEIFVHCLPADFALQVFTRQVLSSVCRLWHELVLATPALWASLDITCNDDTQRPPLPVIGAYLRRSGTHPFSFVLHAVDTKYPPSDLDFLAILAALTTARQRWCNVHIRLAVMTQAILDFIMLGDAPLLQSLKCEVSVPEETFPIPFRMVHGCPRLESFEWRDFGSPLLLPLHSTPLTSLWLRTNLAVPECVNVLRLCPRLLSAEFYNFHPSDSPPAPCLTHTALHTLTAVGEHSIALLAALTLPALLNLDLRPGHRVTPLPTEWEIALFAFLQRSDPALRELSSTSYIPEDALLRILTLTPHLRTLKLSDCRLGLPLLTGALIRALHPLPSPAIPLCPCLQILELPRVSNCPDGLCTAMLRARWGAQAHTNGVSCLTQAHLGLEGGPHDRDEADMKELCADGMQGMIYLVS